MVNVLARAEIYNGYYGDWELDGIDVLIDVKCSSCGRVVYRKECVQLPDSHHLKI